MDDYGIQIWIMRYRGQVNPYFRGMLVQYVVAIPERDAILVRLGHRQEKTYVRETNRDVYRYMDIAMNILDARK